MRPIVFLTIAAPLALTACDEIDDVFNREEPASITELQNTCANELASRLILTRADIRVASTTPTNRGTTGIIVESTFGPESAYCEIDASGDIQSFTRL